MHFCDIPQYRYVWKATSLKCKTYLHTWVFRSSQSNGSASSVLLLYRYVYFTEHETFKNCDWMLRPRRGIFVSGPRRSGGKWLKRRNTDWVEGHTKWNDWQRNELALARQAEMEPWGDRWGLDELNYFEMIPELQRTSGARPCVKESEMIPVVRFEGALHAELSLFIEDIGPYWWSAAAPAAREHEVFRIWFHFQPVSLAKDGQQTIRPWPSQKLKGNDRIQPFIFDQNFPLGRVGKFWIWNNFSIFSFQCFVNNSWLQQH